MGKNDSEARGKSDLQDAVLIDLVQETTKAQKEHGESIQGSGGRHSQSFFRDPTKFEPYLTAVIQSLVKRESLLG